VKVVVLAVGGLKGSLAEVVRDYEKRASRYWKLEVIEVSGGSPGRKDSPQAVRRLEGERLLGRVPERGVVVLLTRGGKGITSTDLARLLETAAVHAEREVCFIIGGAFGVSKEVEARADRRISISSTTLPHEVARLVLTEQLYRAGTILRGEPYHKGRD
jgi:23S rRNA (pseudouridine1915-N3)-methyltransferase